MRTFNLQVVSQEKELLNTEVEAVSAPTVDGEITILTDHIPLITQLTVGELQYKQNNRWESVAVAKGFLSMSPDNQLTVMVDSATHARDISLQKAEEAVKRAKETLKSSSDREELIRAEASLRLALIEVQVAQKSRKMRN